MPLSYFHKTFICNWLGRLAQWLARLVYTE